MTKLLKNMTAHKVVPSVLPGVAFVAISGLGIALYGLATLIITFGYWIEIGLTPALIGAATEQLEHTDPRLFDYITHIQVASCGLLMAFGLTVVALAWFGIRTGQKWALWTAFGAHMLTYTVGLPLHFVYGFATPGHLGPVFLDIACLLVGTVLSYRALYT